MRTWDELRSLDLVGVGHVGRDRQEAAGIRFSQRRGARDHAQSVPHAVRLEGASSLRAAKSNEQPVINQFFVVARAIASFSGRSCLTPFSPFQSRSADLDLDLRGKVRQLDSTVEFMK